jgi:hypothetical protein
VSKLVFLPFGFVSRVLAGIVGKRTFARVWSLFDGADVPDPKQRQATWQKLILALALQGAIFTATRGIFEQGFRRVFRTLTGSWPGDKRPNRP